MSPTYLITILALCSGKVAFSKRVDEGLRNKHLTIVANYFEPYFAFDWHINDKGEYDSSNYRGIMWELLMFMQRARNFTFTLVYPPDNTWGVCQAIKNCTGMLGMVNRGYADATLSKCDFQVVIT